MDNPIAYTNAQIFTGHHFESGKAVLVQDDLITGVVPAEQIPSEARQVDMGGDLLAPAFIDMQIYGGNERLFSHELSIASLEATYAYCLAGGAAHFMITMATNTMEKFEKGIEVVKDYWHRGGKGLLGLHLEGPYINPAKKGAHLAACIKKPSMQEVKRLLKKGKGVVQMITLAPEVCDEEVIGFLLDQGIIVSAGHTNANYGEAMQAFDRGIPAATHLYNAMSSLQHREPGMVGAIFNHPSVLSSVVCDGIHVDFAAVRIGKQMLGKRLFYITDAVAATHEGEYQHVFRGDRYCLPDGTLSGSALTMIKCVENGVRHVGISLEESLCMASAYPAQLLRSRKLGKIEKGHEATFVLFSVDWKVKKVF